MGYRGKLAEQEAARALRAEGHTLADIAAELGVAKSSVSLWVRDVEFTPQPRRRGRRREPNALQRRKAAEIAELRQEGRQRIGTLSDRELLVAGAALYAGDGAKSDGVVKFSNNDARLVAVFLRWLRTCFGVDETRLRVQLYLHADLDLEAAVRHWHRITGIPPEQFIKPYRAAADTTIRVAKHEFGCAHVHYSCSRTHREIMGMLSGLALAGRAEDRTR